MRKVDPTRVIVNCRRWPDNNREPVVRTFVLRAQGTSKGGRQWSAPVTPSAAALSEHESLRKRASSRTSIAAGQREASEAFIKSLQGEGWRLVKTAYDDGGLSGGNMERPALQRLLEDIRHGLIDINEQVASDIE
jgi:hypothetical protein